jgi:hypothetical protein
MSAGKCAYCERQFGLNVVMTVDSFRPRVKAIGVNGTASPRHYWWLVAEWTNLLPACVQCDRAKGSRFPVDGRRARQGTNPLIKEKASLLDPCRVDPGEHLVFAGDGMVMASTPEGHATIEVLALNRRELVLERRAHLTRLRDVLEPLLSTASQAQGVPEDLSELRPRIFRYLDYSLKPSAPFLQATRQLLVRLVEEVPDSELAKTIFKLDPELRTVRKQLEEQEGAESKGILKATKRFETTRLKHAIGSEASGAKAAYFGGQRRIERIVIQNFKSIANLTIEMPDATTSEACLMMVGENGTGKSSILQAITLALIGPSALRSLALDARTFVRQGAKSGIVEISLSNVPTPVRLTFHSKDRRFRLRPRKDFVLLQAYGSTRLLPNSHTHLPLTSRYVRGRNLFSGYARLQHPERWLSDPKRVTETKFRELTQTLKKLLMWDEPVRVVRERRRIVVHVRKHRAALWQLSDGFQSVLALVVDIMIAMSRWPSPDLAEGVVVIDEIEAHLHPVWKMKIVELLRGVFPRVSFIFTTHDPLCLRGMRSKEILVLKSGQAGIETLVVEESLDYLRADQLLTSPLFGLGFTRAPAVEIKLRRYDELAALPKRTGKADREFKKLATELAGMVDAGESPIQRLAYKIAELALSGAIPLMEIEKLVSEAPAAVAGSRKLIFNPVTGSSML